VSKHTEPDPLTLVEDALWWVLTSHPAFDAMVKDGNLRILSQPERQGRKGPRQNADTPEVRIEPAGALANTDNTSSGFGWTQAYSVEVRTNEKRTGGDGAQRDGINPLKWAMIRALSRVRDGIPDLAFVKSVRASGVGDDAPNGDDFDGWAVAVRIDVKMIWAWNELQT
jgi:hypothetical protein